MLRTSKRLTPLLIRDLPEHTAPYASGIPLPPAVELRLAQAWHLGNAEGYQWVPDGKQVAFVRVLCELSIGVDGKTPQYENDEAKCLEAWDAHFGTLYALLSTWRAADQDYLTWWNDPANSKTRAALLRSHEQILSIGPLPHIGIVDTFVSAQESLVALAKVLAYRVFGEVLEKQQQFAFCGFCDAVFIRTERRFRYHTRACGSRDTSRRAGIKKALRRNYRRILVASRYLRRWRQDPAGQSSRRMVTDALSNRDLIYVSLARSESKWFEECIEAALDGHGSFARTKLGRVNTI